MARVTLEDALNLIDPEINKILSTDYRESLDKKLTILDLSYDALKVNVYRNTKVHIDAYNYAYRTLVEVLNKTATRQYSSIEDLPDGYFDKKNAPFVYINGSDSYRFLVARGFDPIRNYITNNVSRDPALIKTAFGQNTLYKAVVNKAGQASGSYTKTTRTKVDIGHIATEGEENLVSPLELKISDILKLGTQTNNPVIVAEAQKALSDLYSIQADISYSFKNVTPESIKSIKNKLGSLYVVVTLHRQKLNKKFSEEELRIFNTLKANIALKLSKLKIEDIAGSNTILEDINEHIFNTFARNGKKLKTHAEHKKSKTIKGKSPNVQVQSKNITIVKEKVKVPDKASFPSLISLQNLLNSMITQRVKENMGTGNRKDILNLRTGRFAESVKIERMSLSREEMITVFYTYMRNPYGTFSEGGQQQSPRSRDPKLLISKSIREIAQTRVDNRLRAVLV
jgi:hypothetical protein